MKRNKGTHKSATYFFCVYIAGGELELDFPLSFGRLHRAHHTDILHGSADVADTGLGEGGGGYHLNLK